MSEAVDGPSELVPIAAIESDLHPDFDDVLVALKINDPLEKIVALSAFRWRTPVDGSSTEPESVDVPGRPLRPELVAPRELKARGLGTLEGRAALVHSVAHIEFNAINLALDAMYRFRGMPAAYYRDWYRVAVDEGRHFQMLVQRLESMGFGYGDFPAHNGLWEAACKTADSCLARMALVPRVLEARGLDVTPAMMDRLAGAGDAETVAILRIILSEEVAHVLIGTRWFRYCCAQQRLPPDETFLQLVRGYMPGAVRKPFNETARREAGFSVAEQEGLDAIADQPRV